MKLSELKQTLESLRNPVNVQGMARFGINPDHAFGIRVVDLRKLARKTGRHHELALELWNTGIHEARILASMVDEPLKVSEIQMESWASEFNSWDLCDQCCGNLFDKTPFAFSKSVDWSCRFEEFVKRAGFAIMAWAAFHNKSAGDAVFLDFLPVIHRESTDERNYVKKAVNWALRQIGKRNFELHIAACAAALEIQKINSRSARWIASDAIRELDSVRKKRDWGTLE
jgi:3-methyladenine DNA glycosylase AlkD